MSTAVTTRNEAGLVSFLIIVLARSNRSAEFIPVFATCDCYLSLAGWRVAFRQAFERSRGAQRSTWQDLRPRRERLHGPGLAAQRSSR